MIESSSSMDRPLSAGNGITKARLVAGGIVAIVVLAAVIAFPIVRRWSRADRAVDATTLTVGTVVRGDLVRDLSVQARVVAALHPTLITPAQGIVALRTKAGSVVRSGDVLAVVDSPEVRSALLQARAQLLSLQSDYERQKIASVQLDARAKEAVSLAAVRVDAAKRALDRAEKLRAEGLMNGPDYEHAHDDLHIAELELTQAQREISMTHESADFDVRSRKLQAERQESAVAELQKRFDDLTIRAPFDGVIAAVSVNERDTVIANQPILNIVNLSSLELEIAIPEEYAGDVRIGTPLMIGTGDSEQPAHITAVSPEIVGNQITTRAVPDGAWPAGLRQNQRVNARLVFEAKHNVLKLPRGAFVEAGGGRTAYVVENNLATQRPIAIGSAGASEVEIVSGLREGERVILSDTTPFNSVRTVMLR